MLKRIIISAAVVPLLAFAAAPAASAGTHHARPASSYACVHNTFGFCGDLNWPLEGSGDRVLQVSHVKQNAPVTIGVQSDSASQDIIAQNENGLSDSGGPDKVFFIAPGGVKSGFCIAAVNPTVSFSAVTVRKCNPGDGYLFQTWQPVALADGDVAWEPLTSSTNVLQDANDGGQGTALNIGPIAGFDRQDITWQAQVEHLADVSLCQHSRGRWQRGRSSWQLTDFRRGQI